MVLSTILDVTISVTWWTLKATYYSLYYLVYGNVEKKEKEKAKKQMKNINLTTHETNNKLLDVEENQCLIKTNLLELQDSKNITNQEIKQLRNEIQELKELLKQKNKL